ncbi:MAG: ATP-binding cassette domain-containing protein [Betaproteobacteria bacterium]|nr:ATP-binding cassette domain-containing protein [Betaproteobacteria bacterium]
MTVVSPAASTASTATAAGGYGSRAAAAEPRGAKASLSQFRRLAGFLLPYRSRILLAMLALTVAAACVLALGQGLRHVIDGGFGSGNPQLLNTALAGVVLVAVLLSLATWARFYLMMSTGERVVADLRKAVFSHVLDLSPAFFDATRTGEIVSRLTNDTTQLQQVIGFGVSMFLRNALMLAGALVMLFITSPKLAALIVLGVPAVVVPILVIGRRVRRLSRDNQDRVADVSSQVDESIHEIRTVQAYVHEEADRRGFDARVEAAYNSGVHRIRIKAWLISLVMLIGFCAVGVILWIGGHDVLAGRITAGELSAFVFYAAIVATGAGTVSEVWGELQRAAGATERLMELLETRAGIVAIPGAQALPVALDGLRKGRARGQRGGAVQFESVTFSYPTRPRSPALNDLSLTVAAGERVALVGSSGAGKTTVMALLLRFYDPSAGRVLVDGVDIARCDPREVRRQFALVPQDPVIFAASVADNVRYGRPNATDAEVRAACAAAHAMDFIERLPQGFATDLGERGIKLSGGERQRLSTARALLADRPILLLDEATSSLDAESERQVALALDGLMRGRTSLVIAHRLATVQTADRIVVLEHGRLHSCGTHAELMQQGGLYSHLARLQFLADGAPARQVAEAAAS